MRCGRYERWIALEAGGDLSSGESAKLAAHLAECPSCREFADAMAGARSEWMALAEAEIDEADLAAVRRGVLARVGSEQRRPWFAWRWAAAGAVALATVAGVVWMGIGLRARWSERPGMVRRSESRVAQGLKPGSSLAGGSARLKSCPDTNHPDVECEEDYQRPVALRRPQGADERGRLESGGMQGLKPEPALAGGSALSKMRPGLEEGTGFGNPVRRDMIPRYRPAPARVKPCPDTSHPDVECEETATDPTGRIGGEVISARVASENPTFAEERQAVVTGRRREPVETSEGRASEQRSKVVAVSSDVVRIQTPDPNVVVYWVLENTGDE